MKMLKPITQFLNLLGRLIFFVVVAFYNSPHRFQKSIQDYVHEEDDDDDHLDRPSPLMVPVPITSSHHVLSKMIKKKLQVVEFSKFLERSRGHDHQEGDDHQDDSTLCVICLNNIEKSQEIREPANCDHVYHRECMDGWVDHGQVTCPLCRIQLFPSQSEEVLVKGDHQRDPWRMERIAFLFGEDYLLHNF